ncbi:MAG: helix-turn-helix transcriptional regulator [Clostridia bacterium]|nr:helix-turn-helix transcriptional regulator [Clostridia bacterium]
MDSQEQILRKNIGKRIKLARAKADFTQEQLAEKLSLSPRYISQLERGIAFGSATTIINVCKALNINSDFLFSDLINNKTPILDNLTDDKFLEIYLKLNSDYKEIIFIIANDLLKKQTKDEMKTNGQKKKEV